MSYRRSQLRTRTRPEPGHSRLPVAVELDDSGGVRGVAVRDFSPWDVAVVATQCPAKGANILVDGRPFVGAFERRDTPSGAWLLSGPVTGGATTLTASFREMVRDRLQAVPGRLGAMVPLLGKWTPYRDPPEHVGFLAPRHHRALAQDLLDDNWVVDPDHRTRLEAALSGHIADEESMSFLARWMGVGLVEAVLRGRPTPEAWIGVCVRFVLLHAHRRTPREPALVAYGMQSAGIGIEIAHLAFDLVRHACGVVDERFDDQGEVLRRRQRVLETEKALLDGGPLPLNWLADDLAARL